MYHFTLPNSNHSSICKYKFPVTLFLQWILVSEDNFCASDIFSEICHTISWRAQFLMSFHSCHLSWLCELFWSMMTFNIHGDFRLCSPKIDKRHQYIFSDLTGNQLNGSIPPGLLKRIQDGSLSLRLMCIKLLSIFSNSLLLTQNRGVCGREYGCGMWVPACFWPCTLQKKRSIEVANWLLIVPFNRYGNNPNLCSNSDSCQSAKKKSNSMLAVYIAVPVVVFVVVGTLALLFFFMRGKKLDTGINTRKSLYYSVHLWQV